MAELRGNQLISNVNSFLLAATQRLYPLVASGDNPASPASDMHGTTPPAAEAPHAHELYLPAAPAQLRSTADCEMYLTSLPGGPAAVVELAGRAAAFKADAARGRTRPELAGPDLHKAVVDVSSALFRSWPRSADAFDSELLDMPCIDQLIILDAETACILHNRFVCPSIPAACLQSTLQRQSSRWRASWHETCMRSFFQPSRFCLCHKTQLCISCYVS